MRGLRSLLDGIALMARLVPAPRAHATEITTFEGLAVDGELYPIQRALIDYINNVNTAFWTCRRFSASSKIAEVQPGPSVLSITAFETS